MLASLLAAALAMPMLGPREYTGPVEFPSVPDTDTDLGPASAPAPHASAGRTVQLGAARPEVARIPTGAAGPVPPPRRWRGRGQVGAGTFLATLALLSAGALTYGIYDCNARCFEPTPALGLGLVGTPLTLLPALPLLANGIRTVQLARLEEGRSTVPKRRRARLAIGIVLASVGSGLALAQYAPKVGIPLVWTGIPTAVIGALLAGHASVHAP